MKQSFARVCCNLISNIFNKKNIKHTSKNNRIFVKSASKKMLVDFNDMTLTFDNDSDPRFRMKKFVKVNYNNMLEMRNRYEDKLTELAKYILNDDEMVNEATHDFSTRDEALLYINGKFYENSAHADCLQQYLDEGDDYIDVETYYRKREFDKYTTNKDTIAFAHKVTNAKNHEDFKNDKMTTVIFLETDSLQNITKEEAAKLFNEHYNLPVYDDNSAEDELIDDYKLLVANRKDLRKIADHDNYNRDYAILYVDGEIISGDTHAECMNYYLSQKGLDLNNLYDRFSTVYRPEAITDEVREKAEHDEETQDMLTIYDAVKKYGFAHCVDNDIFIEEFSLYNCTLEEVANAFKNNTVYKNYNIYNDDKRDRNSDTGYEKIARKDLRKISFHDTYNRDKAILYINGEFIDAESHAKALKEHNHEEDNGDMFRPREFGDVNDKIAFAHYVEDEIYNGGEMKKLIFIENYSLQNLTLNEAAEAFKKQYPDAYIYDDDSCQDDMAEAIEYERIAKRTDLRKVSSHDSYNREEAILYINGEFITANTHAEALNIYNEEHNKSEHTDSVKRKEVFENNKEDIIAFAHKVRDRKYEMSSRENDFIFLETDSLQNITKEEAAKLFKDQFGLEVLDDDSNKDDEAFPSEYVTLASVKDLRKNKFRIQPKK